MAATDITAPDGTKLNVDYLKSPMTLDLDMGNNDITDVSAIYGDSDLNLGYNDGVDRIACYIDGGGAGLQLYEDDVFDLGSASYRWALIRGNVITSGDLAFEEEECAKCGKTFIDGDKLVLVVKTIHEYGTLTVPMHLECCDTPKVNIQLPVPEMELQYDYVNGELVQVPVKVLEETIVIRKMPKRNSKGKQSVFLDKKLGIWKDKAGNVIPTALETVAVKIRKPKTKMISIEM